MSPCPGASDNDQAVTPRFFANVAELRDWFEENHDKLDEQWIGYYKKNSGIPSIDWPESVDAALCYGWIDGIRKRQDARSYKIRFTPRRPRSNWSARNISRIEALIAQGLVTQAGLAAFNARDPAQQARANRERGQVTLTEEYEAKLKANAEAWRYFRSARPSYRKQAAMWVTSAKKETTRLRRLRILVESSASGESIPPLRWSVRKNRSAK